MAINLNNPFRRLFPAKRAQKSVYSPSYSSLDWLYASPGVGDNDDLPFARWGAATAYTIVPTVRNCVDLRMEGVASLPWEIVRTAPGDDTPEAVLATSSAPGDDPLARAIAESRQWTRQTFVKQLAMDRDLYGVNYIERVSNGYKTVGLRPLNPLGMDVDDSVGYIRAFRYSSPTTGRYVEFQPELIAYDHTRNPLDDHRGIGLLETALYDVNISRNLKRFLIAFFRNNALPGMVIMPPQERAQFNAQNVADIQNQIMRFTKGVYRQFTTLVSPIALELEQMQQPDVAGQYVLHSSISDELYTLFRIPAGMRGMTGSTTYKEGEDARINFYLSSIIPLANELEEFINYDILPDFHDPAYIRFRFDTSEFDLVSADDDIRSQVAQRDYVSGIVTLNEARAIRGIDPVPGGDTFYTPPAPQSPFMMTVNGAPQVKMHKADFRRYTYNGVTCQATGRRRSSRDDKKYERTVRYDGDERVVHYGDPDMEMQRDNDERRDAFLERHSCSEKRDPFAPGFWACYDWQNRNEKAAQSDALTELKAWRKVAFKNPARTFEYLHLDDGLARWIQDNLPGSADDKAQIKAVFDEAQTRITSGKAQHAETSADDFAALVEVWRRLGLDELVTQVERVANDGSDEGAEFIPASA